MALTALFIVWTTIVRDDGNGVGYFAPIMAAGVAGFAVGWRSAGMARALLGVALMQLILGALIATAPVVARIPGGSVQALLASAVFAGLWLGAAACFRAAAARDRA